jgi:methylglutaconyl-CoA hydratase
MSDAVLLGSVETVVNEGIATIAFSHPAHNSMPGAQLARLKDAIEAAGANPEVRVIVLASGGDRTFCAGASFDELAALEDFSAAHLFFQGFAHVINAMRRCPKFILARVQGKAIGGGVGLAAAADYCAATARAEVKLSELAVGIGPFVVGPAVARKVGQASFQQLAIDAESFQSAEWALQKGLYQAVLPDIAALDEHLYALARRLSASSPQAMRRLKEVSWEDAAHWDDLLYQRAAISGELVLSEPARTAIARFKGK